MTWIAAFPNAGLSLMVADTRVSRATPAGHTVAVEEYRVQKIHALTDQLIIGFAGNITQGFRALALLESLMDPENLSDTAQMDLLLTDFAEKAARLSPPLAPLQLVALGVRDIGMRSSPTDQGFTLMQGVAWTITPSSGDIKKTSEESPDPRMRLASIGSGSLVPQWHEAAIELADHPSILNQFAFGSDEGGEGAMLAIEVTSLLQRTLPFQSEHVRNSVSDNLFVAGVSHKGVIESTNLWVPTRDDRLPLIRTPDEHRYLADKFAHHAQALVA